MEKLSKKTLILGATTNPERIAWLAAQRLRAAGHEIVPVGIKKGEVAGVRIVNDKSLQSEVHTITLYIGEQHQREWYDYILSTAPQRIIFNPGTENEELANLAAQKGIQTEEACTLVLLSADMY